MVFAVEPSGITTSITVSSLLLTGLVLILYTIPNTIIVTKTRPSTISAIFLNVFI